MNSWDLFSNRTSSRFLVRDSVAIDSIFIRIQFICFDSSSRRKCFFLQFGRQKEIYKISHV